jgi:hypothetical protein
LTYLGNVLARGLIVLHVQELTKSSSNQCGFFFPPFSCSAFLAFFSSVSALALASAFSASLVSDGLVGSATPK